VRFIEILERDEQSLSRILDGLDQIQTGHADGSGGEELDLRKLATPDQSESR
jgi:hypothetical protein